MAKARPSPREHPEMHISLFIGRGIGVLVTYAAGTFVVRRLPGQVPMPPKPNGGKGQSQTYDDDDLQGMFFFSIQDDPSISAC